MPLTPTAMLPSIMKPIPPEHLLLRVAVLGGDQLADPVGEILVVGLRDKSWALGGRGFARASCAVNSRRV